MFTKSEAQLIAKTLTQRREWLLKNIDHPEHAAAKEQNQKVLELIESSLAKLLQLFKVTQAPVDIISTPIDNRLKKALRIKRITKHRMINALLQSTSHTFRYRKIHIRHPQWQ